MLPIDQIELWLASLPNEVVEEAKEENKQAMQAQKDQREKGQADKGE